MNELRERIWAVIRYDGTFIANLTYLEAFERASELKSAVVTTNQAAERMQAR